MKVVVGKVRRFRNNVMREEETLKEGSRRQKRPTIVCHRQFF